MTENTETRKEHGAMREILEWVVSIAVAIAVAFLLKNFVLFVAEVDGNSMLNTLHDNERLITWKLGYNPQEGDIIILEPKVSSKDMQKFYVKRVIATEGQTVEVNYDENAVYVDGEKLEEPYVPEEMEYRSGLNGPVEVPEGHVYVLGDNRNHSSDSRNEHDVGFVSEDRVLGKAVFRFWPLNKLGIVK